jgi:carbonic anhydrase
LARDDLSIGLLNPGAQGASKVLQSLAPIAAIIACTDSREASETVFDQGVGPLFSMRAGNMISGRHRDAAPNKTAPYFG